MNYKSCYSKLLLHYCLFTAINLPCFQDIPVKGMILSAQFWPAFREEKLELPTHMQTCLENYTKSFAALKGNRTLSWKPHMGSTTLCY